MDRTLEMIAVVQWRMLHADDRDSPAFRRLERIETYLIRRYNREG